MRLCRQMCGKAMPFRFAFSVFEAMPHLRRSRHSLELF